MHRFKTKELKNFVFSYDAKARAAYIQVRPGRVHITKEHVEGVFIDLDSNGHLLGVEVLDPKHIEIDVVAQIAKKFHIPHLKHINPRAIPDLYAAA